MCVCVQLNVLHYLIFLALSTFFFSFIISSVLSSSPYHPFCFSFSLLIYCLLLIITPLLSCLYLSSFPSTPCFPFITNHHIFFSSLSTSLLFPAFVCVLLFSVRLMMCGTVWARCCRLRETLQLPPSVSSPPWSWRPAAPSCHSPSYPEHYETCSYSLSAVAQLHKRRTCEMHTPPTHTHTNTHSMPACHLHTFAKVLLPNPQKHTLYRNAHNTSKHIHTLSQIPILPTMPCCVEMGSDTHFHFGSSSKLVKISRLIKLGVQ